MKNLQRILIKENAVIRLRGLVKSFGDLSVLKGIDLDVYEGENVVVLGRSGSGKSVLIKLIAGMLKPDQGSVKIFGMEVPQLAPKVLQQLRLRVGFSFRAVHYTTV